MTLRFLPITLLLITAMLAQGCQYLPFASSEPNIVVPEYDTVEQQARAAYRQYEIAQGTAAVDARLEEYRKTIAALDMVVQRFPEDDRFTPAAHLMKGDLQKEIEANKAAEQTFRRILDLYPDIPDVHSGALLGLGDVLTESGRGAAGKQFYRQLMDIYGNTDNPIIRERVRRADRRYSRVIEQ